MDLTARPAQDLSRLLEQGMRLRLDRFDPSLRCHAPSFKRYRSGELEISGEPRFAAVSTTGGRCDLGCEHCGGALLASMSSARGPAELVSLAQRLAGRGVRGLLVSGGCTREGRVELAPFHDAIREIRLSLGLAIVAHVGLVQARDAEALAATGVDRVLMDVVGDRETALRVLHLDAGPERFAQSLRALCDAGLRVVPHVVCGLGYGEERGEPRAIEIAAGLPIDGLVLVALRPEPGTGMASVAPPGAAAVARLLVRARLCLPSTRLMLGCARPLGGIGREIEHHALLAGVNGIAFPADETVRAARQIGLAPVVSEQCCCLGTV